MLQPWKIARKTLTETAAGGGTAKVSDGSAHLPERLGEGCGKRRDGGEPGRGRGI